MPETTLKSHLYDFGGAPDAPLIHLAIANGFPPETYRPLVEPLTAHFHVITIPPRALWHGEHDPREMRSWHTMADDIREGLRIRRLNNVIAMGHSMGGVASMLATIDEPTRFRGLILLDPTIMLPHMLRLIKVTRFLGQMDRSTLVQRTKRRRREFESAEAAFEYFRKRPLFANWPEATIRLYAESITRPAKHGQGVELAWSPEWEAQYYRTLYADSWRMLPRLRGLRPTLVIRGVETDTFLKGAADRVGALLPDATLKEIEGHGHLFPQSAPDQTREIIVTWLSESGLMV